MGTQGHSLESYLQSTAEHAAPDVRFGPTALVPFVRLYRTSLTPFERAKVCEDWVHLLLGTERACKDVGLSPPYEMHNHPSDALARSWRCVQDGAVVVEVHFHLYLGADREEVRALKVEMQANKAEMDAKLQANKAEMEAKVQARQVEMEEQMQDIRRETDRQVQEMREEAERSRRESSAELREVPGKMEEM